MSVQQLRLEEPRSRASQVAVRLRDAIINAQFRLGELISEDALASAFGVSRTPVREALGQLQNMGLVVVRPQRGSYVFSPTAADISSLCEFRCVIEPQAAELAWARDRDAALKALSAAVDDMEEARARADIIGYSQADTRLHEAFIMHCGNPYLKAAYATAGALIAALRTHLSAAIDLVDREGPDQHLKLVQLFEAGDFAAFGALMREHVNITRDIYLQQLPEPC